MVPVVLTMAVLYIWTSEGGNKPPSATDIALFFHTRSEWMGAFEKNWRYIGLGLPISEQIRIAAEAFHVCCSNRLTCVTASIVPSHTSRALEPAAALKQARLRQLAWVTSTFNGPPVEIRTRNNPGDRPPKGADPTKMKPDLPGFTPHEAFLLTVAVAAGNMSSHHAILSHQAGQGYSEHFGLLGRT